MAKREDEVNKKEQIYEVLTKGLYSGSVDRAYSYIKEKIKVSLGEVESALKQLQIEGRISISDKGKLKNNVALVDGIFAGRTSSGNGFVTVDNKDYYIASPQGSVTLGQQVKVGFTYSQDGEKRAFIVGANRPYTMVGRVLRDNDTHQLVFQKDFEQKTYAIPQNDDMEIACSGNYKCEILFDENGKGIGIQDVLGFNGDPIVEGNAIARSFKLHKDFSPESIKQVHQIPQEVEIKDLIGRKDYRKIPFITIDPATCKDRDDAVYCEKLDNGNLKVMIAISDVGHYVPKKSPLFQEAMSIGNSTYLGGMVYPMLPPELSNGICSLNGGKDRLAMVTSVEINPKGERENYSIEMGVINSSAQLSYEEAEEIFVDEKYKDKTIKSVIENLYELNDKFSKFREKRGGLTFKEREPSFALNESKDKVLRIEDHSNVTSHAIIESAMLIANEAWANFAYNNDIPYIHRIHKAPNLKNIYNMKNALDFLKVSSCDNLMDSLNMQKVLKSVKNTPKEIVVNSFILKGMEKAKYSTTHDIHFGLGIAANEEQCSLKDKSGNILRPLKSDKLKNFKENNSGSCGIFVKDPYFIKKTGYSHTTSPIRRGADTCNQLQISNYIQTGESLFTRNELEDICTNLNLAEKNSAKAEEVYNAMLTVLWAKDNIGQNVEGVVTECRKKSVKLNWNNINVIVPINELDVKSIMHLTENGMELTNKTKESIKVGDTMFAQIYDTDSSNVYASEIKYNESVKGESSSKI